MSKTKEEILNSHLAYGKDTYLAGSEEAILKAMDAWADHKLEEYKARLRAKVDEEHYMLLVTKDTFKELIDQA